MMTWEFHPDEDAPVAAADLDRALARLLLSLPEPAPAAPLAGVRLRLAADPLAVLVRQARRARRAVAGRLGRLLAGSARLRWYLALRGDPAKGEAGLARLFG